MKPSTPTRPIRVGVITAAYPSPEDPTRAVFLRNLLQRLAADSFQVLVVAPRVHARDPACQVDGPIEIRRFAYPSGNRRLKELGELRGTRGPAALWIYAAYAAAGLAALLRALRC